MGDSQQIVDMLSEELNDLSDRNEQLQRGFLDSKQEVQQLKQEIVKLEKENETLRKKPNRGIDHVVIRCNQPGKLEECIRFYQDGCGLRLNRMDEYKAMCEELKAGLKPTVAFPGLHINEHQMIDLFPVEIEPYFCETAKGNIDHFCMAFTANEHLECLKRFKEMDCKVKKVMVAFGAQGQGLSTYLVDPTGLYVELRNYEENRWQEVREFADTMMMSS